MRLQISDDGLYLECPTCGEPTHFLLYEISMGTIGCDACGTPLTPDQTLPPMEYLVDAAVEGSRYFTEHQPAIAQEILAEVLAIDEWHGAAHNLMGIVYDESESYDERKESESYNEGQEGERALHHLGRAVALDPRKSKYHYDLGVAYSYQQAWLEARAAFEKALEIFPVYLGAMANLMGCYLKLEEGAAAAMTADRVLALDREGRYGDRARSLINRFSGSPPSRKLRKTFAIIQKIFTAFHFQQEDRMDKAISHFATCLENLEGDSPASFMISEYIAGCYLALDMHVECLSFSQRARRGLPCVTAIVPPLIVPGVEAGMFKDATEFFQSMLEALFGVRASFVAYSQDAGSIQKKAMVMIDGDSYTLTRAGNIFRLASEDGELHERVVYEDTYFSLENF